MVQQHPTARTSLPDASATDLPTVQAEHEEHAKKDSEKNTEEQAPAVPVRHTMKSDPEGFTDFLQISNEQIV